MKNYEDLATDLLGVPYDTLDERSQNVLRQTAGRQPIAKNTAQTQDDQATRGERAADAVARFGGSWTFIGLFAAVMISWITLNSVMLANYGKSFDPYPYILLNLVLSMLAAIQAPIMLMSQNRQSQKDRYNAEHDYEVNLKAELEIMLLHKKIDGLREQQWEELLAIQQNQIELLTSLLERDSRAGTA
ncbi:DUF1003 domain-containing protein [Oxalobacteraceae bacterium]|nr:DUF1003 domain-containing protein [Oxalobacteraceae bacterium]